MNLQGLHLPFIWAKNQEIVGELPAHSTLASVILLSLSTQE